MTKEVLRRISSETNHTVSVSSVKIAWLDRIELNELLILDRQADTLIYADRMLVNYRLSELVNANYFNIEEVHSSKFELHLIKHDSLSAVNLTELLRELRNPDRKRKPVNVEEVSLANVKFSYDDRTKPLETGRLDVAHLDMHFLEVQVSDLHVIEDSVDLNIIHVEGKENRRGLEIKELSSIVHLNSESLSLLELNFQTPTSQVSDSIKLYYNGLRNLSHFVDSVSFGFYFSNTIISDQDIQLLIGVEAIKSPITFDGTIWGTVQDFNMDQTKIGFGKESYIEGGLSCFGLPNLSSTFALADITSSHVVPGDIEPYIGQLSNNVAQLGRLDFTGSFAGFLNDFVARGDFVTEKGSVHSDINIKIPDDPNDMSYSGNLQLKNMDLGAFLRNQELFQVVNMDGRIEGEGIKASNAHFDLDAKIYNSGFYGYSYDTIRANGTFASNFFSGEFSIDDPNCKVVGDADLDFNLEDELLRVNLNVDSTHLNKLNLAIDTLITGGNLVLDVVNLDLDEFTGTARIDSGFVRANNREVMIESITFQAELDSGQRKIRLSMPGVDAEVVGDFKITTALRDLAQLAEDYNDKIQLRQDTILTTAKKEPYKMELFAKFDNLSRYLDSLDIPLEIPDGSFIEATFRESKNANLFVYAQAEYIRIGQTTFHNPVLELNGSRALGASGLLTNFIIDSDRQEVPGLGETKNLLVEGIWLNNKIDLTTSIVHDLTKSNVRFESEALLTRDSMVITMMPSKIVAFDDEWVFNSQNSVTILPNTIKFNSFDITDGRESIELRGIYSAIDTTSIEIKIKQLELEKANIFTDTKVDGLFDAAIGIFRNSFEEPFQFDGGFQISDLALNDFPVGDITGNSIWNASERNIYSKVEVDRENFRSIELTGLYHPFRRENQLDFELRFDNADLQLIQPFLADHVTELAGSADGKIKIGGNLGAPTTFGTCQVSEGQVRIIYLNTMYEFGGPIEFEPSKLKIDRFNLIDRKGSVAEVTGHVSHNFFTDVFADLSIDAVNFEFLNTTAVDNSLYYGSANGTGSIDVSGPLSDLLIKASVRTEKDTRLFVPVTEDGEVSVQDYISFLDFNDTTEVVEEKSAFDFQGFTVDFDIEVTPDAYCELIFDIKTGDIIRGRGRGNLKLTLDADGEFHMFGPLEITDGAYNFTVPGFINKEFTVTRESRITWFGDPYNGTIDLDAIYLQRASFEPLQGEEDIDDNGEFTNRIGINVMLGLSGGMLSPAIDFDLQIADKIDETPKRLSKLTQIGSDEQELKRQVISLLFFKRFSPPSTFTLGGGGNVGNSVSEFFSNQVSYLVSQLDENLEVEVDLADFDNDAFNTFQLRLAYTFLDGRLKVTRGGDFAGDQTTEDNRLLEDIVGDWSVEYSLTKDGRLRAKVFRATNQQITTTQGDQSFETGVSLRFVHSFNEVRDLLTSSRREALKRRKQETQEGGSTAGGDVDTF